MRLYNYTHTCNLYTFAYLIHKEIKQLESLCSKRNKHAFIENTVGHDFCQVVYR